MRLRIISSDGSTSERVAVGAVVRLGRDPACEVYIDPVGLADGIGPARPDRADREIVYHAPLGLGRVGAMVFPGRWPRL
jgi:hypothetical protein